jgi:hypothetical protein
METQPAEEPEGEQARHTHHHEAPAPIARHLSIDGTADQPGGEHDPDSCHGRRAQKADTDGSGEADRRRYFCGAAGVAVAALFGRPTTSTMSKRTPSSTFFSMALAS